MSLSMTTLLAQVRGLGGAAFLPSPWPVPASAGGGGEGESDLASHPSPLTCEWNL